MKISLKHSFNLISLMAGWFWFIHSVLSKFYMADKSKQLEIITLIKFKKEQLLCSSTQCLQLIIRNISTIQRQVRLAGPNCKGQTPQHCQVLQKNSGQLQLIKLQLNYVLHIALNHSSGRDISGLVQLHFSYPHIWTKILLTWFNAA